MKYETLVDLNSRILMFKLIFYVLYTSVYAYEKMKVMDSSNKSSKKMVTGVMEFQVIFTLFF